MAITTATDRLDSPTGRQLPAQFWNPALNSPHAEIQLPDRTQAKDSQRESSYPWQLPCVLWWRHLKCQRFGTPGRKAFVKKVEDNNSTETFLYVRMWSKFSVIGNSDEVFRFRNKNSRTVFNLVTDNKHWICSMVKDVQFTLELAMKA